MKCAIYCVVETKNSGITDEEEKFECYTIGLARKWLNNCSYLTKNKYKVNKDNVVIYYEIRYKFTDIGYDTTNEKWYVK